MLAVCFLSTATERSGAQDAIFQGDAERTGQVASLELPVRPVVLWKYQPPIAKGQVPDLGGLLVAGPRLFCSDRSGRVFALRTADGVVDWHRQMEVEGRSEAPLVMGDIAYFATSSGLVALSALDGSDVWKFSIDQGANESSPLMIGDLICVAAYDGMVYGLDAQSGKLEWTCDVVSDAPPSPRGFEGERARLGNKPARPMIAASDGTLLFQPIFDQSRVVAIDAITGQPQWSFQAGGWIHGHPVVAGNEVYIGSQDDALYRLDKATGTVFSKFHAGSRIEAGAAANDELVVFGACNGQVFGLDAKTKRRKWNFACDNRSAIYCAPLLVGETVFIAGMEGQVYALNAANGELRWKMRPEEHSEIDSDLATDGKRLFLTTRPAKGQGETAIISIGPTK